jgi:hypothetical protein
MIARLRGEHQDPWTRWRPRPARGLGQTEQLDARDEALVRAGPEPSALRARPSTWLHRVGAVARWLTWVALVSVAYVAISWVVHQLTPQPVRLPATPRAWLDAYEAAALDNPSRVCSELFAPQLASAYAHGAPGGCRGYFGRVTSSSVTVRRTLEQGSTAVLELRQTLDHRDWAVVLARHNGGWQAVDLLGLSR